MKPHPKQFDKTSWIIRGIMFLGFVIFISIQIPRQYRKSEQLLRSFDLKVTGEILNMRMRPRGTAMVTVLVAHSTRKVYDGKGPYGNQVKLSNDTLSMRLDHAGCLALGDSVIIGPADFFQTFRQGKNIIDYPNATPECLSKQ